VVLAIFNHLHHGGRHARKRIQLRSLPLALKMDSQRDYHVLQACESEPIHIPGAIQPFGILLNVDLPGLVVRNASVNCHQAFGIGAEALVGRSLAEFVAAEQIDELQQYIGQENLRDRPTLQLSVQIRQLTSVTRWELSGHYQSGCLILELEPVEDNPADIYGFHTKIRNAVQALQLISGLQQLCDEAAKQVQLITGFDRVMLYRFSGDWHGEVVAEACAPHMHSYLKHHFPASDIPAQARAVFLQNWLRMIPDVDYVPVPLFPGINPLDGAPLDLGKSTLRSVSPVHVEYLRNMNVAATLTLSLVDQGKLWGLIACHHATPRLVDTDARLAVKTVAQLVSSQINLKTSLDEVRYRAQLRNTHAQLLSYMEQEQDLVQGLVRHVPNIVDLANTGGASAAIRYDNKWTIVGNTPGIDDLEQLIDWLAEHHAQDEIFYTRSLGTLLPAAKRYRAIASGVLAVAIPKSGRDYLFWFRPEVAQSITWAGNPEKKIQHEGSSQSLHPRSSFNSWREIVEGTSLPWAKVEIDAVIILRNSILALDLKREFRKEQAARALAERISQEKENMVHMVSHDIRTPLSVIKMSIELLQRTVESKPERAPSILDRALRATNAIEQFASAVLNLAKIENGTMPRALTLEDAESMVHEAIELSAPIAEGNGIHLHARLHAPGVRVLCERTRIWQLLGNLISNALKFTAHGGEVLVSVESVDHQVLVTVADSGIGISPERISKIFDRFYQGEHKSGQGAGLGLAIAKEIVEQHDGRMWAESTHGVGTKLCFTLPAAVPAH
jgi:chemotaxis family two-component system sensor kinase Cph1